MRNQGPLKSSCNAGELAPSLYAKVGLKQYYSGAKRMKNIEPVPQAGYRLMPGSRYVDAARSGTCRLAVLPVTGSLSYVLVMTPGFVDIYNANTRVKVRSFTIGEITADRLEEYCFYGEANTFGFFHRDDWAGERLTRDASDETSWTRSDWPYETLPTADLGGSYTKTNDKWEIYFRYTSDTPRLVVSLTVDGETSDVVKLKDGSGTEVGPSFSAGGTDAVWDLFATNIAAAINALPSIGSGVTCTYDAASTANLYRVIKVNFGSGLSGSEYEFDCQVVSGTDASSLVAHTQAGETQYENLISSSRGGFSGMTLFQDRAIYFAPKAKTAALAMSRTGEYFDLNIEKTGDDAARLEALRTETSQRILSVVDGNYLLIFTDQGEWFVNNRTIKQDEPLNFIPVSDVGTKQGVTPQKFDGKTWFISRNGASLYSIVYDAVSENFQPTQEDLLATHLIEGVKRMCVQRKVDGSSMPRLWILRDDGRLVSGTVVAEQEITAFVEWVAADDGVVCDIAVDGQDRVWIVVQRGSLVTIEQLREAENNLFQCSVFGTTDLTGRATGLSHLNGKTVWGRIDGYIAGPFTVSGGMVETEIGGVSAQIGLWQPPIFESMPYYQLLQNDDVLRRPARVHTVTAHVLDTESIAIGANGRAAKNIPLARAGDDLSAAPAPYSGPVEVYGLMGIADGPTVTITQTRPGLMTLRDYIPGVKF